MNVFDKIRMRIENVLRGYDLGPHSKDAAERIKKRTRLGYGVEGGVRGGQRERLGKLSDSYIATRKKARRSGKLSSATSPKRSNLTFTGQLLDSLRGMVKGNKIIVYLKKNRDDGKTNPQVAGYVENGGRPFFELTDKEVKGLRNNIKKDLIKTLRRKNK